MGPVSEYDLGQLAAVGTIGPETLVWHAGLAEWQSFRHASESFGSRLRFCTSCGNGFPASELAMFGDSAVCAACKPAYVQRLRQGMDTTAPRTFEYAGFWIRFVAALIDGVVLELVQYVVLLVLGLNATAEQFRPGFQFKMLFGAGQGIGFTLGLAYYATFWTMYGATPGKMALGLKIVRPDGGPISAGRAVGRYFAEILSALTLMIGYMMAGWDSEKRALHDRIADTRVIKTR